MLTCYMYSSLLLRQKISVKAVRSYLYLNQLSAKKIHQLEEHFQVSLFVRSSRGVVLTSDGQNFLSTSYQKFYMTLILFTVSKRAI